MRAETVFGVDSDGVPVDVIIRWVSRVMTLVPGDVIATGTPAGVGPLKAGDVVEVMLDGIAHCVIRLWISRPEPCRSPAVVVADQVKEQ